MSAKISLHGKFRDVSRIEEIYDDCENQQAQLSYDQPCGYGFGLFLGLLTGSDDDFDVPDWGSCPLWHYGWSAYALRQLCLKFG